MLGKMFRIAVLLLFSACDVLIAAQEASITIPPLPINTSVNGEVEFSCTAYANGFVWKANESQLDSREGVIDIFTIAVNKAVNLRKSTVRMIVSLTDNTTNITCIAISQSPPSSDTSDPALLLVQGLLEPASNLTLTIFNSTTVLISWSPPFTLEGVPIQRYIIHIINIINTAASSDKNETVQTADNTTLLYYTIDPNVNNNVTVTVFSINEAGKGEPVFTTTNILSQPFSPSTTTLIIPSISQLTKALLTTIITTTNLISEITDDHVNNVTALLSTVQLVIISVSSVVTSIMLLTIALLLFLCCARVRHVKRQEARKDLKEVIMMNDSEAYAVVKRHDQLQRIETHDNSAYDVIKLK